MPIAAEVADPFRARRRGEHRRTARNAATELNTPVVVSRDTLHAAGLTADEPFQEILLRGRPAALPVCALGFDDLRPLGTAARGIA